MPRRRFVAALGVCAAILAACTKVHDAALPDETGVLAAVVISHGSCGLHLDPDDPLLSERTYYAKRAADCRPLAPKGDRYALPIRSKTLKVTHVTPGGSITINVPLEHT
jgi:hypothetical protein